MFEESLLAEPSTPRPDLHAGRHVFLDRRDARAEPHVGAGAVRRAAAGRGEFPDLVVVDMDGVREPDVLAQPAQRLHPVDRPQLEALERVALLVQRLAEMGVEPDLVVAGQGRRLLQERRR